ncbi:MAG: hydrolase [Ferruginibacter sp.]|nr:hydrolase [Ferruginibacter sp.]
MKQSAGILLYRFREKKIEFFLVHPGGPFWKNKDHGSWSIPKGEFMDEDPLAAAQREFLEETGFAVAGDFLFVGETRLKSGKTIMAWAVEGDLDPAQLHSNAFEMEWPPRSGKMQSFPEVDKGNWFSIDDAREKLNPAQIIFLDRCMALFPRP